MATLIMQEQHEERSSDARSSSLPLAAAAAIAPSPRLDAAAPQSAMCLHAPQQQDSASDRPAWQQMELPDAAASSDAGPSPPRFSSLPPARRVAASMGARPEPVPADAEGEYAARRAQEGFPLGVALAAAGGSRTSSLPPGPPPSATPPLPPGNLTSQPLPPRPTPSALPPPGEASPSSPSTPNLRRPVPPPPQPIGAAQASGGMRLGVSPRKSSLPLYDEPSQAAYEADAAASASSHTSTSYGGGASVTSRSLSRRGHAAESSTSTAATTRSSSLGKPPGRIPSRVLLQTALELAQRAVEYDRTNDVPRALAMYRDAVVRLRSVMLRVGIELGPLPEGLGLPEPTLAEQEELARVQTGRRAKQQNGNGGGRSEEEGRTLKGIHDAYIARIGLLCVMQASPPPSATLSQGEFSSDLSSAAGGGGAVTSSSSRPQSSRSRKSSLGSQEHALGSQGTSSVPPPASSGLGLNASVAAQEALLSRDAKRLSKELLDEVHGTTRSATGSIASSDGSSSRNRMTNEVDDLYPPPLSTPPKPRPRVTSLTRNPASSDSVTLHDVLAGGPSPVRKDKALPGVPFEASSEQERTPRVDMFSSPDSLSLPSRSLSQSSSLESDTQSLPPPINGFHHSRQKSIGQRSHRSISSILEANEEDATLQPGDLRSQRAGSAMTVDVQRAQQGFESPRRFAGRLPSTGGHPFSFGSRRQDSNTPPPLPTPSQGMLTPGQDIDGFSQHSSQTLMLPPASSVGRRSPQPSPDAERPPTVQARRPFHLMRLLQTTIIQPHGGFLSDRLHVPQAIWTQAGVKLPGLDTKTRVLELLIINIGGLSQTGNRLLQLQDFSRDDANVMEAIARDFARDLDEFEVLLDEMQKLLSKKLGIATIALKAKKSGSSGISGFGSRLTKTLDKMTNGKTLDSPTAYIDALSKLCNDAQKLDPSAYDLLAPEYRSHIETRLRRSSDFFGNIILPFVLQDVNVLLSKYLKQSSRWLNDE